MPTAAGIPPSDLGSYQQAARLVLTHDLITATRPRAGPLDQVLRWADQLTRDLREVLGYTLIATTRQVRLVRRLDALDSTQTTIFAKNGRPFDRRRLAYLCLVLASFQRSRVEVSLADLVRALTPTANAIDGLRFDATITSHKAAVVDVLDWLVERGALRLSDGSAESWAHDSERGDALYDIDHDIASALFRPARPVQHLTSAAGLLDATLVSAKVRAQREAAAQQAARALIEYPVVYYAQVQPEVAEALRTAAVAENLARLTGLAVERRAEGVMLADSSGRFTDKPFPAAAAPSTARLACSSPRSRTRSRQLSRAQTPPRGRALLRTLPMPRMPRISATSSPASTPPSRWLASSASSPGPRRRKPPSTPNVPASPPIRSCPRAGRHVRAAHRGQPPGADDRRAIRRDWRCLVLRHLAAGPARPAGGGR